MIKRMNRPAWFIVPYWSLFLVFIILPVIAAIFLSLRILTGLLGVNIGGIPGVDNTYAFGFFCGILFVIVLIQIIIFKKNKWF